MKAYKVELLLLDFEKVDENEIVYLLENIKYLHPHVMTIRSAEIGEWDDDHPLNSRDTSAEEFARLFP